MRIRLLLPLLLPVIFILTAAGCGEAERIDEDTFVNFYCDMILAQDSLGRDPAAMDTIRVMLYERYGLTNEEYMATIEYYNTTPRSWENFFNKALAEMQRRKTEALGNENEGTL